MKYTHVVSEDGRKIAARFGELLTSLPQNVQRETLKCLVPNGPKLRGEMAESD